MSEPMQTTEPNLPPIPHEAPAAADTSDDACALTTTTTMAVAASTSSTAPVDAQPSRRRKLFSQQFERVREVVDGLLRTELSVRLNELELVNARLTDTRHALDQLRLLLSAGSKLSARRKDDILAAVATTRPDQSAPAPAPAAPPTAPATSAVIYKRRDGKLIRVRCPECMKEDFKNYQGFANHCRMLHRTFYPSHDDALFAAGVVIEPHEVPEGVSVIDLAGTQLLDMDKGGLVSRLPLAGAAAPGISTIGLTEAAPLAISSRFFVRKRVIVGNTSQYISPDRRDADDQSSHKWMVYVRGPAETPDLAPFVKHVKFFLHPSYKPNDVVDVTSPPFHLTRRGWGEFPVRVQLHFVDPKNKPLDIIHNLKLDRTNTGLQTLGAETTLTIDLDRAFFDRQKRVDKPSETSDLPSPSSADTPQQENGATLNEFFMELPDVDSIAQSLVASGAATPMHANFTPLPQDWHSQLNAIAQNSLHEHVEDEELLFSAVLDDTFHADLDEFDFGAGDLHATADAGAVVSAATHFADPSATGVGRDHSQKSSYSGPWTLCKFCGSASHLDSTECSQQLELFRGSGDVKTINTVSSSQALLGQLAASVDHGETEQKLSVDDDNHDTNVRRPRFQTATQSATLAALPPVDATELGKLPPRLQWVRRTAHQADVVLSNIPLHDQPRETAPQADELILQAALSMARNLLLKALASKSQSSSSVANIPPVQVITPVDIFLAIRGTSELDFLSNENLGADLSTRRGADLAPTATAVAAAAAAVLEPAATTSAQRKRRLTNQDASATPDILNTAPPPPTRSSKRARM